jgi:hypothetical protein
MASDDILEQNFLAALGEESPMSGITPTPDGGMEVDLSEVDTSEFPELAYEEGHYANLVNQIDERERDHVADRLLRMVDDAELSRKDWEDSLDMGLDMMGIKLEEKNTPFMGACSAHHPLLMENAVKFQSKASAELLPASGPVETKIFGEASLEREHQALRIKKHMNYQITEEMSEYYPDTEKMLLHVALIGSGFKKTYYDAKLGRPVSEFVPADQFIVPNNASDLYRAPYYAHKLFVPKDELLEMFASGFYDEPEMLGEPTEPDLSDIRKKTDKLEGMTINLGDEDKVYNLLEIHCNLFLETLTGEEDSRKGADEYDLPSPYVVTIDKDSRTILGIRRNWKESDIERNKLVRFVHYGFVPGFGFYNYGFIHLLGNLQLSLTSSLRSLVDAGQFSNLQGGFKLKGVRIVDNDDPIAPGEFKEIEAGVQDINKAIMRLPFGEPSNVLYQMLEFLDRKGQKFADSTEQVVADSTNYGPVGTTLALLDASTKFFSAVHKRLHNAQKHELKLIAQINSETLQRENRYNRSNPTQAVTRQDYDERIDVVPVSDPNISSNAHRIAKASQIYEIALKSPDQFDMREVLKHVLVNMDYDNVDKLLPPPEQAQPNDPLTDIQLASQGKPIKAFPQQDHESHIRIKTAFIQDPFGGASQAMASTRTILEANIQEHVVLQFTTQVQAAAQQQGQQMAPEQAMAQAAQQQVAQQNQQRAQQEAEKNKDDSDEAAHILAQAEMLSAQTEQMKETFQRELETARFELDKEKLRY